MTPNADLIQFLKQKALWVRKETLKIHKIAPETRIASSLSGDVNYDITKPDGNPVRLLDTRRITALGLKPKTPLEEGLRKTYEWYKKYPIKS